MAKAMSCGRQGRQGGLLPDDQRSQLTAHKSLTDLPATKLSTLGSAPCNALAAVDRFSRNSACDGLGVKECRCGQQSVGSTKEGASWF